MANNKLWLVHRPSGEAFYIGGRTATVWGAFHNQSAIGPQLSEFFEKVNLHGEDWSESDDFVLAIEDDSRGAPGCTEFTRYENHKPKLRDNK